MDFGKMKVVELRAELQARGLDTKGKFSYGLFGFGLFFSPLPVHPTWTKNLFYFCLFYPLKGVKAALIDRLKEALDLEEQNSGMFCFECEFLVSVWSNKKKEKKNVREKLQQIR